MTPAIHANCVVIGTKGILLRGASGSGKSYLSDHLIGLARANGNLGALVSDDRVFLSAVDGRLIARAPDTILGKLEIRGFGIVECASTDEAAIDLVIDLLPIGVIERFPDQPIKPARLGSVEVPSIICPANEFPASVRLIRWALRSLLPQGADYI